jgi:hypothetical protein
MINRLTNDGSRNGAFAEADQPSRSWLVSE